MDRRSFIAKKLMEAWFTKSHSDQEWLNSPDGQAWTEISLLDAAVAEDALEEWNERYSKEYPVNDCE